MVNPLDQFWRLLPFGPLRSELLTGSVGSDHLRHAAGWAQDRSLALALLLAAWEADPLDGSLAREILDHPAAVESGNPLLADLERIAAAWRVPLSLSYYERIAGQADRGKLEHFLLSQLDRDPDDLFWLWQLHNFAFHFNAMDLFLERIQACDALPPLTGTMLRAECLLLLGHAEQAAALLGPPALDPDGPDWAKERFGHCLFLQDDGQGALDCWLDVLLHRPWHLSLLSRCASVHEGLHRPLERESWPGSLCALLYSYNHGEQLDRTLAALMDSDPPFILALDNGSSDSVPQVLASWQERAGRDRMEIITLPVNIGAPAARNWLMAHERTMAHDFAMFLDDDALVPKDWAGLFMRAVRHAPNAHVWGCLVKDQDTPWRVQSADLHLRPSPGSYEFKEFDPALARQQCFATSSLHLQVPDLGGFSHVRSCASVTGCCHMFRVSEFHEHGPFDLRLSPTQYDDLERDIRLAVQGRMACCQGHLVVRHMKGTGKEARVSDTQRAKGLANRYTMYSLYSVPELEHARDMEITSLEQELVRDIQALQDRLDALAQDRT